MEVRRLSHHPVMRALLLAGVGLTLIPAPVRAIEPGLWVDSLAVPDQAITHMSTFDSGEAFVYFHNRSAIYISDDHGLNWLPSGSVPSDLGVFEMASPSTGYFADRDQIWQTDDAAITWEEMNRIAISGGSRARSTQIVDITAISPIGGRLTLGGQVNRVSKRDGADDDNCRSDPGTPVVLTASDGGKSGRYRGTTLDFSGMVDRLGWLNRQVGWVLAFEMESVEPCGTSVSISKRVLITRDGGRSYRQVHICRGTFQQQGDGYCTAVAMSDRRTIVIGKTNGWVYISKNGGDGFEPAQRMVPPGFDSTYTHWISGIGFADNHTGYAVAKGGGTWRTDDGGETWTYEPSSQQTWGVGIGDIAVADSEHAIAGGPNTIISRQIAP